MRYLVCTKHRKFIIDVEDKDVSHLYKTHQIYMPQASITCGNCLTSTFKLGASKRTAIEHLLKVLGVKGEFSITAVRKRYNEYVPAYICPKCAKTNQSKPR